MSRVLGRSMKLAVLGGRRFKMTQLPGGKWGMDGRYPAYQTTAMTTLAAANNDPVGGIPNIFGGTAALQGTAGKRPLLQTNTFNGNRSFLFNSRYLTVASLFDSTFNTSFTAYVVASGYSGILFNTATAWRMDANIGNEVYFTGGGKNNLTAPANAGLSPYIYSYRYDGVTMTQRVNGYQTDLANTTSLGMSDNAFIGIFSDGGSLPWADKIAAMYIYGTAHSTAQMALAESYLRGVFLPPTNNLLVPIGDSQTYGPIRIESGGTNYAKTTLTSLGATWLGTNASIWGTTIALIKAAIPTTISTVAQAHSSAPQRVAVLWAGTNDVNSGVTGAVAYADTVTAAGLLRTGGFTHVIGLNMLKRGTGAHAQYETQRQAYNSAMAADSTTFDAKVDVAGIAELDDVTNTTYYHTDQIHVKAAGHALIAAAVTTAVQGLS